ncbi:MAG: cadherin repeat protein [Bacteroidota bacterium]|nr:cadherin repeat protein [Bacteroidota bacterium]
MKKAIFSSALLFILILTSCTKSTTTTAPVETDKLKLNLTTTKAAYVAAASGSWIEITAAEYNTLATTLTNVTRSGVAEADYTNVAPNNASGTGTYTIAQNDGATMPTGSYLFGFKISINTRTNTGAKVKISNTSVGTGFADVGSVLPDQAPGEHYFVLKGNSTATTSTAYLGFTISLNVKMNYKVIPGKGSYYYEFSDASTLTNFISNDAVFLAQGLSSTVKQW